MVMTLEELQVKKTEIEQNLLKELRALDEEGVIVSWIDIVRKNDYTGKFYDSYEERGSLTDVNINLSISDTKVL